MAVVQISKIQVRRGRKNTDVGIPQLSSGELGWAIDTQELYIGNGAVSEGAPFVGNTKVLTENDNILDLALQYQYSVNDASIQTGSSSSEPVRRSLQQRLDETVSIYSFGAVGDGNTDDTDAIQRALDQLYLNPASKGLSESRVSLFFPPGTYVISNQLYIPPYCTIVGAGIDKTIILQTGNYTLATTVNESSVSDDYKYELTTTELNQPRNINISNITLKNNNSFIIFDGRSMKDSEFQNVKFEGSWQLSSELIENDSGLELTAISEQVTSSNNVFRHCIFKHLSYAIQSKYDIDNNIFDDCIIDNCGIGIYFGYDLNSSPGRTFGPRRNKFISCLFKNIDRNGILIEGGQGNLSTLNTFVKVGNDGGTSNEAVYSVIKFLEDGNVSENDQFERSIDLSSNNNSFVSSAYIGEYEGSIIGSHKFNNSVQVIQTTSYIPMIRLSAFATSGYHINYIYTSSTANYIRKGIMYLTVDRLNNQVHLVDKYDFLAPDDSSGGGNNLKFLATLDNIDGVNGAETVTINYRNTTVSDNGTVRYWYEVLS